MSCGDYLSNSDESDDCDSYSDMERSEKGIVNHGKRNLSKLEKILLSGEFSDVTFVAEGRPIHAHRAILAAQSRYFATLLFNENFAESKQTEIKLDVAYDDFNLLLHYIYIGKMNLNQIEDIESVLRLIQLADFYEFEGLKKSFGYYLQYNHYDFDEDNLLFVLNTAKLCGLEDVVEQCLRYSDGCALDILKQTENLNGLSKDALVCLLERSTFYAPEETIFKTVTSWIEANKSNDNQKLFSLVRLELLSSEFIEETIKPSGYYKPEDIEIALGKRICYESLNYRYRKLNEYDDVSVIITNASLNSTNSSTTEITYQLDRVYMINHITFFLKHKSSYQVSLSVDKHFWKRGVDYSKYQCFGPQQIYFEELCARYIKFIVTDLETSMISSENIFSEEFNLKIFNRERDDQPNLVGSIIEPVYDVIDIKKMIQKARELAGNSPKVKSLTHTIGNGEILFKLHQPYWIRSIGLQLSRAQGRAQTNIKGYKFYIETSLDNITWQMAVDQRGQFLKLNHLKFFSFEPRYASFIRVVGTEATAGDIFPIFECSVH